MVIGHSCYPLVIMFDIVIGVELMTAAVSVVLVQLHRHFLLINEHKPQCSLA